MRIPAAIVAAAIACAFALPALAHHSFAMFDRQKMVSISGTVKAFEWTNPHCWLWVTAKGPDGESVDWGLETAGPGQLARMGLKRESFKPGDKIVVDFHPLRDGRKGGQLQKAALLNGDVFDVQAELKTFSNGGVK